MADRLIHEGLPVPWSYGVTYDGRIFFIDERNHATTWLHPVWGCPLQTGHMSHQSLPSGWEANFDLTGKPFYVNHIAQSTSYLHPRNLEESNVEQYSPPWSSTKKDLSSGSSFRRKSFRASQKKSVDKPPVARRDFQTPITKEGWLYKQESGIMKPWKRRWCVLTDYCLFCYEDESQANEINSVVLPGYWINACGKYDSVSRKFAFKAEHKNMKTFYFSAESETEMNDWLTVLTKAAALQESNQSDFASHMVNGNKENVHPTRSVNPYDPSFGYTRASGPPGNDASHGIGNYGNGSLGNGNYVAGSQGNIDYGNGNYGNRSQGNDNYGSGNYGNRSQGNGNYGNGNSYDVRNGGAEPSATSTPVINLNRLNWNNLLPSSVSQNHDPPTFDGNRSAGTAPSRDSARDGFRGNSLQSFPGNGVAEVDPRPWNAGNADSFRSTGFNGNGGGGGGGTAAGQGELPIRHGFSRGQSQTLDSGGAADYGAPAFWKSGSVDLPNVAAAAARHGSTRGSRDQGLYGDGATDRHFSPQYLHETSPHQRPGDYGGADGTARGSMEDAGPRRPPGPPAAAVFRDRYIDEIAETRTPHSREDLLQAKEISRRRLDEPNYFQYPESPPKSQQRQEQTQTQPQLQGQLRTQPVPVDRPSQNPKLNRLQHENTISKSMDEVRRSSATASDVASVERTDVFQDGFRRDAVASTGNKNAVNVYPATVTRLNPVSPGLHRREMGPMARTNIEAIKEDPDMPDTEVLNSKTLQDMQKHMLGHTRLRLSISVRDLVGKSQEELVLLLIQLRRSQAVLEELRSWARERLANERPKERAYKIERKNSVGRLDDGLELGHRYFAQLDQQSGELDKQIEVTQPLINLLDNIVTMGSLYNGDNLMYASQYKKNQLNPDQLVPEKKMLEFSRRHQEESLARKQEQSIRKLTEDEVDLEEKLQQLYVLDSELQERSLTVTMLQEDKWMLERTLENIRRSEKTENDLPALESLFNQRQICEKELMRVRQQLAEASKLLEETSTENGKVEEQVVLLRNRLHGGLTRSQSTPSLVGGSGRVIVKLEEELKQVQALMDGLASQGTKISEAMQTLKTPAAMPTTAVAGKTTPYVGYTETDLDTKVSRDLSVRPSDQTDGRWSAMDSAGPATHRSRTSDRYLAGQQQPPGGQSHLRSSGSTLEYRYMVPPPGNRYANVPTGNRYVDEPQGNRYVSPAWNQYGSIQQQRTMPGEHPGLKTASTSYLERAHTSFPYGASSTGDFGVRQQNVTKPYDFVPNDQAAYRSSVRDVKKRETSRRNPNDISNGEDARYSVLQRSRSLPRMNSVNALYADYRKQSMDSGGGGAGNRRKSSYYLTLSPTATDVQKSSAMQRLFPSPSSSSQPSVVGGPPSHGTAVQGPSRSQFVAGPQPSFGLPKFTTDGGRPVLTENVPRFVTVAAVRPVQNVEVQRPKFTSDASSQRPIFTSSSYGGPDEYYSEGDRYGRSRYPDVMENITNNNEKLIKPETVKVMNFDGATIDQEVFQRPKPVEIPERYLSDEDESLTEDERRVRRERSEKLKKILAKQSLQDFKQGELTMQTGPVHRQIDDETRRREQILDVKRALAHEVMQKSKDDAARHKTWSSTNVSENNSTN